MNDMDKMEIISVEEAAERLNIGRGSLYKLLKDRDSVIKAFRINRTWKIPDASIEEYIKRKSGLDELNF